MGILALILARPVLQPINLLSKPKEVGEGRREGELMEQTPYIISVLVQLPFAWANSSWYSRDVPTETILVVFWTPNIYKSI